MGDDLGSVYQTTNSLLGSQKKQKGRGKLIISMSPLMRMMANRKKMVEDGGDAGVGGHET